MFIFESLTDIQRRLRRCTLYITPSVLLLNYKFGEKIAARDIEQRHTSTLLRFPMSDLVRGLQGSLNGVIAC